MMAYDPECELLAEYFLRGMDLEFDTVSARQSLARSIQDTVEAFLNGLERGLEASSQ